MKFLETEHERKSFIISTILFVLMFLLFFFVGLKYLDPPIENGIALNFGTSDEGMGDIQPNENEVLAPELIEDSFDQAPIEEEILTQNIVEAPVEVKEVVKKAVSKKEVVKKAPSPKPSQNTSDALSSLINGPKIESKAQGGEGNDNLAGDKGKFYGRMYSDIYAGSGTGIGLGDGNSWGLKGRKLSGHTIVVQKCNEEGKVVLKIWVNKSGKVTKVERTKGTQNATQCLVDAAIETAKTFNWLSDENAPEVQIGFIVVNFKLS